MPKLYEAHLQTPDFLKYKTSTRMVRSLELVETIARLPEVKVR